MDLPSWSFKSKNVKSVYKCVCMAGEMGGDEWGRDKGSKSNINEMNEKRERKISKWLSNTTIPFNNAIFSNSFKSL